VTEVSANERAPVAVSGDDIERLRLVTLRLARRIRTNSVDELTPSQQAVFASVAKNGPITIGRIADLEHVRAPSASKIVASLEERDLIERAPDPDDRRCALISLTPTGVEYLENARAAGRTWLATQLGVLDADAVAALLAALRPLELLLAAES
jgi:DNA-binding MarR family transcriptional regulator